MRRAVLALLAVALLVPVTAMAATAPPKYLNKRYSNTVHDLRDCLSVLSDTNRRLVVLRSGIGPQDPASPQQVATELGISAASVASAQWAPIREMRAAQKAGKCGNAQPAAAKPVATKPAAAKPKPSAPAVLVAAEPADKAGWSDPKVLILVGIAGLCLLGVLREVVRAIRA